jgi:hypothetical protein
MFPFPMPRRWAILAVAVFGLARPYVPDTPELTDYKHFGRRAVACAEKIDRQKTSTFEP